MRIYVGIYVGIGIDRAMAAHLFSQCHPSFAKPEFVHVPALHVSHFGQVEFTQESLQLSSILTPPTGAQPPCLPAPAPMAAFTPSTEARSPPPDGVEASFFVLAQYLAPKQLLMCASHLHLLSSSVQAGHIDNSAPTRTAGHRRMQLTNHAQ